MTNAIRNLAGRQSLGTFTANGTSEVTFSHQAIGPDSLVVAVPATGDVAGSAIYIATGPTAGSVGFKATGTNDCVYNVFVL